MCHGIHKKGMKQRVSGNLGFTGSHPQNIRSKERIAGRKEMLLSTTTSKLKRDHSGLASHAGEESFVMKLPASFMFV